MMKNFEAITLEYLCGKSTKDVALDSTRKDGGLRDGRRMDGLMNVAALLIWNREGSRKVGFIGRMRLNERHERRNNLSHSEIPGLKHWATDRAI